MELQNNRPAGEAAAPAAPGAEQPRRRVGSLTLGVSLVAAGIFFLCYHFVPNFNWQLVLQIAPAVALVLLGGEVLYFATRPGRWKCDFWSVLGCLVLMGGCFCLSLVPVVWQELSPARRQAELQLEQQYTRQVYQQIKETAPDLEIKNIQGAVHLYSGGVDQLEHLDAVGGWVTLNLELMGPYHSAEAFAQDCRTLTDAIQAEKVLPDQVTFWFSAAQPEEQNLSEGALVCTESYTLNLEGLAQLDWTAQQMADQTLVESLLDQENEPEEASFSDPEA